MVRDCCSVRDKPSTPTHASQTEGVELVSTTVQLVESKERAWSVRGGRQECQAKTRHNERHGNVGADSGSRC